MRLLATARTPVAPLAVTLPASAIATPSAGLAGQVDPYGQQTAYTFEYGTTTSFGALTAIADAGSANGAVAVMQPVDGLQPGTTYLYRVVATNASGTSSGAVQSFTTPATG